MKKYKINFGVRGVGVQLLELTEEEKDSLLKENLDDIYIDFIEDHDWNFAYENQYITPECDRYHLTVEDEDGNTLYETEDFTDIKDATYDDEGVETENYEFEGVEDGCYLTRVQTLKGCSGSAEFELPDDKEFNPDNLYVVQDTEIDDELIGDTVFPMYGMYYQLGEKPDLENDILIEFDDEGYNEEQYYDTYLMELKDKRLWTNLQDVDDED